MFLSYTSSFYESIYYAVPKCASSTLKQVLCFDIENKFTPGSGEDTYFKFTVVRNPWDRLVSMYFNCKREANPITGEPMNDITTKYFGVIRKDLDFDTFIKNIFERRYFLKVSENLTSFESHFLPCNNFVPKNIDYIVKYKNFSEDIRFVMNKFGIQNELPVINKSDHNNYREYYSDKNLELVDKMYRVDLERFGFTYA